MTRALLLVFCTAALPALAFEGVVDTKMTYTGKEAQMSGTGTITIKGMNFRMDIEMTPSAATAKSMPIGPAKMTTIARGDEPGITYIINDRSKTYQKLDAKHEGSDEAANKWTVKRLGKETIAGRTTEHVELHNADKAEGDVMEVWVDTQLVSASDMTRAFAQRGSEGWWKALQKAGVAGIPLKFVSHSNDGKNEAVWEATKVTAKSVPSSTFEVPAGYTEGSGYGGPGMGMGKGMKLTPEQQKQLQEMMQKQGK